MQQRLIEQHPLRRGAHPTREHGMCTMEMVAWLAGEEHSDEPRCSCPVIAAFVRAVNDSLHDEARNRLLRPLVPKIINTRATAAVERVRGLVVVDTLVRQLVPVWLQRHHRHDEANLVAALQPLHDTEALRAAARALEHFGRDQHAARWVLQRALDGMPPARYVAGAVQVARALNDAPTWATMVAVAEAMARVGRPSGDPLAKG
jgi:hypothetical protein